MKNKWTGLIAAFLPFFVSAQEAVPEAEKIPVADYVRFLKADVEGQSDALQTAITRFERKADGAIVDLVAVVHIGDAEYFTHLNRVLKEYDSVLYELVGGEFSKRDDGRIAEPEMESIRGMQGMAQRLLGLEFQLNAINYAAENFVHADVKWDEFHSLMAAKNQNMATMFTRAMELASKGEIEGIPATDSEANAMMISLLGSLASGDTSSLKRTIAPFLSEAESLITQLEGDDGTVLVSERNKVVMKKLGAEMAAHKGKELQKIAIFYGAGHMPDLEERLKAKGFAKDSTSWTTAWDIPAPQKGTGSASSQFFQSLLSEEANVLDMLQSFGKALNEAQQQKSDSTDSIESSR